MPTETSPMTSLQRVFETTNIRQRYFPTPRGSSYDQTSILMRVPSQGALSFLGRLKSSITWKPCRV